MLHQISIPRAIHVCWFSLCLSLIACISGTVKADDEFRFQNRVLCIDSPWAYDSQGKKVGKVFAHMLAQEGHTDELVGATSTAAK